MDYMNFTVFLTADKSVIVGGQEAAVTNAEGSTDAGTNAGTEPAAGTETTTAPAGGLSLWTWVLIYAVVLGGYFLFVSRGQKKKQKQVDEMRSSIQVGDSVCTTSGMYGKIADIGENVFVVEFGTNKGVRVPVNKADVAAVSEPVLTAPKIEN